MTTYTTSRGPCARPGCAHVEAGHLFRADTPKLKDRERGACTHQDFKGKCSCPQYVAGVVSAAALIGADKPVTPHPERVNHA